MGPIRGIGLRAFRNQLEIILDRIGITQGDSHSQRAQLLTWIRILYRIRVDGLRHSWQESSVFVRKHATRSRFRAFLAGSFYPTEATILKNSFFLGGLNLGEESAGLVIELGSRWDRTRIRPGDKAG